MEQRSQRYGFPTPSLKCRSQSGLLPSRARLRFFRPDKSFEFIQFSNFWGFICIIDIWQLLTNLLNLVDDGRMMYSGDSFYCPKAHAIRVHLQTVAVDFLSVTRTGIITVDELSPTGNTDVILFPFLLAIFADVSGMAFWTLHHCCLEFIPSLCNAH